VCKLEILQKKPTERSLVPREVQGEDDEDLQKKIPSNFFGAKRILVGFFCKIKLTWKEPMELLSALREAP
jgi:hypothetical protein